MQSHLYVVNNIPQIDEGKLLMSKGSELKIVSYLKCKSNLDVKKNLIWFLFNWRRKMLVWPSFITADITILFAWPHIIMMLQWDSFAATIASCKKNRLSVFTISYSKPLLWAVIWHCLSESTFARIDFNGVSNNPKFAFSFCLSQNSQMPRSCGEYNSGIWECSNVLASGSKLNGCIPPPPQHRNSVPQLKVRTMYVIR